MRRRTVKAAVNLVAEAIPSEEALIDAIMSDARTNVETCTRQLAEQQLLAAEWEAKKPGSFRARTFAKTVESWQERTDKAIDTYNGLAAQHGQPSWNPDVEVRE